MPRDGDTIRPMANVLSRLRVLRDIAMREDGHGSQSYFDQCLAQEAHQAFLREGLPEPGALSQARRLTSELHPVFRVYADFFGISYDASKFLFGSSDINNKAAFLREYVSQAELHGLPGLVDTRPLFWF